MTHTPIDIAALEALLKVNETYIRPFSGLDDPADGLVRAVPELIKAAKERDALVQGLNSIVNMKSHVGRTAVREYAAVILKEKAYSTADQSPIANTLASLRALLAEAGEALRPFAEDASRIDARGVIMPHACASVGDYQRIARLHATIQTALRETPTSDAKPLDFP